MGAPAIFWDRDNTLVADPGYIDDPDKVALLPGAAAAVRRLAEAGFENIIATNQSGIARGLLDEPTLAKIHDRLHRLFAEAGAGIDAIYYCPYLDGDEAKVPQYRRGSDLCKPKPGMLLKASLERKIDLVASWSIGDSLRDAKAGRAAGCRTILIQSPATTDPDGVKDGAVDFVADSIDAAAEIVLNHTRTAAPASTPGSTGQAGTVDAAATLQEILAFLRMADRRSRSVDFSLTRLVGTVVQILALGVLLWAVFGWFLWAEDPLGVHLLRLLLAVFLQMFALTCFMISSKR